MFATGSSSSAILDFHGKPLHEYLKSVESMEEAARNGYRVQPTMAIFAVALGNLPVVKWIFQHSHDPCEDYHKRLVMFEAARQGRTDILDWVVDTCPEVFGFQTGTDASECAARNGKLESLQWLRAHGFEWSQDVPLLAYNHCTETDDWTLLNYVVEHDAHCHEYFVLNAALKGAKELKRVRERYNIQLKRAVLRRLMGVACRMPEGEQREELITYLCACGWA
jgi:hypothetical protein